LTEFPVLLLLLFLVVRLLIKYDSAMSALITLVLFEALNLQSIYADRLLVLFAYEREIHLFNSVDTK
jgi:hypothetical protein